MKLRDEEQLRMKQADRWLASWEAARDNGKTNYQLDAAAALVIALARIINSRVQPDLFESHRPAANDPKY